MNKDNEEALSLSSDEDSGEDPYVNRRAILEPAIRSVVDALGGYEGETYRLGDECYGCLKDLKKFWRKDDTDDDRTVARVLWAARVLPNDLVPIVLETAGRGLVEDRRAVACADLMTAMTWPIDLAAELKELDEEADRGADFTELVEAHLGYKAALLRPGVLGALFAIALQCLARREESGGGDGRRAQGGEEQRRAEERDVQIVNVVLHLVRNLAFIRDPPANMHASADRAELSTLQSRLIRVLSDSHFLEMILAIASNAADDAVMGQWNTLALEILYLLFRGVKPTALAEDQTKHSTNTLASLLAVEDQRKRDFARKANTRHSRFGTTISVTINPKKQKNAAATGGGPDPPPFEQQVEDGGRSFVMHRQQALTKDAGAALDLVRAKRQHVPKGRKVDELGRDDSLSLDARVILQTFARSFIEACFNPLVSSLLKDIKAERPKITEKDHLRLLFVTKWFLEYFLCERARQAEGEKWKFGLIAEVMDRGWIVWVLKRMREAQEEKPKLWTELQAGLECLAQFVLAVDTMVSLPASKSKSRAKPTENDGDDPFAILPGGTEDADEEDEVSEAAQVLQQQIVYNGEVLDIAFESMRTYKEGTQSLAYLDASVHLAYALLRMLERWSKGKGKDEMYVRKRAKPKKKKGKTVVEGEGVPDVEEEEPQEKDNEEVINETMFTFSQFEKRFANPEVTRTLLAYLERYKEFSAPEQMKRVVSLMHRQAVKQKAEGLYFLVSTLYLFRKILTEEKSLPRTQPYKDLVALINYVLRKFFKSVEEDSFLIVEAYFPKNRGQWKQFSSVELDAVGPRPERLPFDNRFPQDLYIKKGYTPSEQIGIAMAALTENGQTDLIEWTRQILGLCIAHRQRIIDDVDGSPSKNIDLSQMDSDDEDMDRLLNKRGPSAAALAKINDYLIPYVNDDEATAANKNPHLKLLFRLISFKIMDEDAKELEWFIPSTVPPAEMQRSLNIINQYLETPIDLEGKKAAELMKKKKRRRVRRKPDPVVDSDAEEEPRGKKKEKRRKEKQQYKSAEFIVDSDAEMGDMDEFLAKEKELRDRTEALAASTGQVSTMRAHGTKKRRRKGKDEKGGKKRRKRGQPDGAQDDEQDGDGDEAKERADAGDAGSEESEPDNLGSPRGASPKVTAETSSPRDDDQQQVARSQPRPRPRPRARVSKAAPPADESSPEDPRTTVSPSRTGSPEQSDESPSQEELSGFPGRKKRTARLVFSDEDE